MTAVLVLRALGLGDALTAVPALRGLRRRYGDRRLVLAGPAAVSTWFAKLGLVDEVLPTTGLSGRPPGFGLGPHVAVNLHGRGPQSHRLLQAADPQELIAFNSPEANHHTDCTWRPDEHEVARWCRLMNHHAAPCAPADLRLPTNPTSEKPVAPPSGSSDVSGSGHGTSERPVGPLSGSSDVSGPRHRTSEGTVGPLSGPSDVSGSGHGTSEGTVGPLSGSSDVSGSGHGASDGIVGPFSGSSDVGGSGGRGVVVVHPGAASQARRWPVGRWAQVVGELRGEGYHVVLTGTEIGLGYSLSRATGAEDLCGLLSIEELADCVASAAVVLSGDTGVAHLATALGTRSVTLFGPVPPTQWGPAIDHDRHTVLYHGTTVSDPHGDQVDPALLRISVSEVLSAVRVQLRGTTRSST